MQPGTNSSASPTDVRFDHTMMWVSFADGRVIGVPLSWFPVLDEASPAQRKKFWLSPLGIHWDDLDEDISAPGLLEGRGDMTNRGRRAASEAAE